MLIKITVNVKYSLFPDINGSKFQINLLIIIFHTLNQTFVDSSTNMKLTINHNRFRSLLVL